MDPVGAIAVGSAAGALFYVLTLLVGGKLHTTSEVNGLREDKKQLFSANVRLAAAVEQSNVLLQQLVERLGSNQNPTRRGGP